VELEGAGGHLADSRRHRYVTDHSESLGLSEYI